MRFVTGDFFEALTICTQWRLIKARVFVLLSLPTAAGSEHIFGQIAEAYGSNRNQAVFFKMTSGQSLLLQAEDASPTPEQGRRLFPI